MPMNALTAGHGAALAGDEVVLRRAGTSTALGAVVYLVIGPFFGALLGLFAMGLIGALLERTFGAPDRVSIPVSFVVGFACLLGGMAWAFHDFRRRAGVEIVLGPGRLSRRLGRRVRTWTAADVEGIRLANAGRDVLINLAGERPLRIPGDLVAAATVVRLLERFLVPALADRHADRLAAGDTIVIRDLGLRAIPTAVREVARLVCFGALLRLTPDGRAQAHAALVGLRQCARGIRGGFSLRPGGLQAAADGPLIPYDQVTAVRVDPVGLRVETLRGFLIASPAASHYFDVCHLLRRYATVQGGVEAAPT